MPAITIPIKKRMGRSPVAGYYLWDDGHSLLLNSVTGSGKGMRNEVRLPKDPADLGAVIKALMAAADGQLSLQALLSGEIENEVSSQTPSLD